MITGGSEAAIMYMGLGGFIAARALSQRNDDPHRASRPFDKDRDGFVLSEGSGILVLEEYEHARRRDARIYAEVLGAGATADAYNITAPHPEGTGASRAMQLALERRAAQPERHAIYQRPRHQHRAGRRGRDEGDQKRLRRARPEAGDQQHQEHDRPSARRLGRRRSDRDGADDQARRHPSDDQSRHARPGVRSRLRAEHAPARCACAGRSPTASASAGTTPASCSARCSFPSPRASFPALGVSDPEGSKTRPRAWKAIPREVLVYSRLSPLHCAQPCNTAGLMYRLHAAPASCASRYSKGDVYE